MPTESRIPVSRLKLGIFGVLIAAAALTVVVSGIRAREESSAKLREWTDDHAVSSVAVIYAAPGTKYDDFQLAYALDLLRGKVTVASVTKNTPG